MSAAEPDPTSSWPPAGAAAVEAAAAVAGELVRLLEGSSASRLEVVVGDIRIFVDRSAGTSVPTGAPADAAQAGEPLPADVVTAPLIGTLYRRRSPTEDPFADVGDAVEAGQVVAIVEAMKMMNEVVAEVAGVVTAIHAEDGELVEFGQPLVSVAAG